MARGDLLCPIDNLPVTLPVFNRVGPDGTDVEVGDHIHVVVSANGVCSNGHRWVVDEADNNTFMLRRIV